MFATCFAVEEKLTEILDHNGGLKNHKVMVTYSIEFHHILIHIIGIMD